MVCAGAKPPLPLALPCVVLCASLSVVSLWVVVVKLVLAVRLCAVLCCAGAKVCGCVVGVGCDCVL